MTDQITSLTPGVIKDIVTHLDESILLLDKYSGRLTASEIQVKSMLSALRQQLLEHLHHRRKGDSHD